jgi:hypothetical protein
LVGVLSRKRRLPLVCQFPALVSDDEDLERLVDVACWK